MAESATMTVPDPQEMPRFADPDLGFLYGEDPTPNVVGMTPMFESDGVWIRTYIREGEEVTYEDHQFYPYFFCDQDAIEMMESFGREKFKYQSLDGQGRYSHLVAFQTWGDYSDALDWLYTQFGYPAPERDEDGELDYDHRKIDEVYLAGSIIRQFQIQSGITSFLDMTLDDVHRLQLDIEVYSSTEQFPDADREGDEIIMVSLTDNRGKEIILTQDNGMSLYGVTERVPEAELELFRSEEDLLLGLKRYICEIDPDVIETFNGFNFDLPYILDRCERHDVIFGVGRDGSEPFTWESQRTFAERDVEYQMVDIAGRSVIDVYFLVLGYDVFAREMKSHTLKESARHFGVAAGTGDTGDRTYIEGEEIADYWDESPEELIAYAADDVKETRALGKILSESPFYLSQVLPAPYHDVERLGTATVIENLFVREYLRQRQSIPTPDEGVQGTGGYTDLYMTGVIDRLIYADVSSLYPSIMLEYNCQPPESKDPIHFFERALDELTDMRLEVKGDMRDMKEEYKEAKQNRADHTSDMPPMKGQYSEEKIEEIAAQIEVLDAKQSSYKILINSFYGSLGFKIFSWNAIGEADRVAEVGQAILKKMIAEIEKDGGTIIEVDTDGVVFSPIDPETGEDNMGIPRDEGAEADYVRDLTERMPPGIEIDHDGSFHRMISYKKKNYALKKYDQDPSDMKIKGGSLMGRSSEQFGRDFVEEILVALMERDVQKMHDTYLKHRERIKRSDWEVEEFYKKESLKETFEEYTDTVEKFEKHGSGSGYHSRQARFEVAIRDEKAGHAEYQIGDRVKYYVAKGNGNVGDKAKHIRHYEEDQDEDTQYYLDRLDTFASKFEIFFDENEFRQVFGEPDMFGFDPEGIEIKTRRARKPLTEVETPEIPDQPE